MTGGFEPRLLAVGPTATATADTTNILKTNHPTDTASILELKTGLDLLNTKLRRLKFCFKLEQ